MTISFRVTNVYLLISLRVIPNVSIVAVRFVRYCRKDILVIAFSFIFTDKEELLISVDHARFTSDHFSLLKKESDYGGSCLNFFMEKDNMDLRWRLCLGIILSPILWRNWVPFYWLWPQVALVRFNLTYPLANGRRIRLSEKINQTQNNFQLSLSNPINGIYVTDKKCLLARKHAVHNCVDNCRFFLNKGFYFTHFYLDYCIADIMPLNKRLLDWLSKVTSNKHQWLDTSSQWLRGILEGRITQKGVTE